MLNGVECHDGGAVASPIEPIVQQICDIAKLEKQLAELPQLDAKQLGFSPDTHYSVGVVY